MNDPNDHDLPVHDLGEGEPQKKPGETSSEGAADRRAEPEPAEPAVSVWQESSREAEARELRENAARASAGAAEFERPGGLLSKVDGHLVLYHDPRSLQAEQYRACRTRLTALNRVGAPWAVVLTSSRGGEDKAITAANLAGCLAEMPGARVCLLEVDSRHPAQAQIFGVAAEPGTVELLEGNAALKDVVRTTLLPGVDLIPAGGEADNPAEMLGDTRLQNLLDELKRRYTWVLIDAPPVHPYTDACVVTPLTQGVLLVVRLGETPREMVSRTIENIEAAGGSVLGSFVTGRPPGVDDEERLGGYGYGYSLDEEGREVEPGDAHEDRKTIEKRLRKQESAIIRQQEKRERRDDGSPV